MRIDFAFGATDRLGMACEVVRKQYQAGQPVLIYCTDPKRLAVFSRKLWALQDTLFIPHDEAGPDTPADSPVRVTRHSPAQALQEGVPVPWLLNLDLACPPDTDRFARLLEIVSNHELDKAAARVRYKQYTAARHDVRAHNISSQ
ncbi:DNA polymerase III subunit chi [Advenella sp. S44]|uniref:DNA polymerase III subunit chi n=1 Tax=Advenella sp. S44 TaxID=1982755 RepID=UPI000C299DC7|nr:DNA polymerase III subunit chi [Advenella sp. S44]PJX26265.1 DNA polymerase III subunit chi [Advenella sp. S44]